MPNNGSIHLMWFFVSQIVSSRFDGLSCDAFGLSSCGAKGSQDLFFGVCRLFHGHHSDELSVR